MRSYLLGIDIGTSACKVGLFDNYGMEVSSYFLNYKTFYPEKNYVEQNPNTWWDSAKQGIKNIILKTKINPKRIKSIGVDSMTPVLLAVDSEGNPLFPALIWSDKRALKECEWIDNVLGQNTIFNLCGNKTKSVYLAPKIIWLKNNRPDIFEKTFLFLQPNGYINYKLCGSFSMDRSNSELTLLADKWSGEWGYDVCKILGIPIKKMPCIKDCDEIIGYVTKEAAIETGLEEGTPVIAGGNDCAVAAFALNVTTKGQSFLEMGYASNLGICLDEPKACCDVCDLYHHVAKNKWILQSYSATAGAAFRWFKEEICDLESKLAEEKKINPYELLDNMANKITIGCDGLIFIPYLEGLALDPTVKGAFLGLSTSITKPHMTRAILEGCAFANRKNMEAVEAAGHTPISEIFMIGGGSNSYLWTKINADVLNKKIIISNIKDAAVLGVALLAGTAVGLFGRNLDKEQIVKQEKIFKPDKDNNRKYNENYDRFKNYLEKNCMI